MKLFKFLNFCLAFFCLLTNLIVGDEKYNRKVQGAVKKSIALIEKSAAEYLKHRECFSCHHQAMPVIALNYVDEKGFAVDEKKLQAQVDHTFEHFKKNIQKYLDGKGTGGQVDTAGYGLWALHTADVPKDKYTEAVVTYLAQRDKGRDFWRRSSQRPPSEASNFTATYVAVKCIEIYGIEKQKMDAKRKLEKVKKWWKATKAKDTEDLVFKILLGQQLGLEKEIIMPLVSELSKQQNKDGGWSQTDKLESDAYATATAMYALHESGFFKPTDEGFNRGATFLLKSQKEDGSWHVKSRSSPFQEYFESGFPHKDDQFISITATCWAIMVLSNIQ